MVTAAGGQVPTRWSSVRTDAIRNHWATIARASPGAFDGDRLLVGDAPVRLFVPGDFTGHVPPAWSEEESCGPEGQTTRRWERWSIVGVDQTAAIDGRVLRALGPGIYRIEPPNATTLTIEHTASLELGHEWGIDDDCGPDRRHSDTLWVNHTVERRLALRRVRSENLSVTAFVLTRPGRPDEVHYHVEGNRGLRRGGLGSVTLSMGAARHTWHTPWAFYPVRGYDAVRIQRRNGTTLATVPTAFRTDARFPNLYRDRLEAERHVVTANQIGFLPTVRETGAPTENRPFDTAVKTAAAAESLYTHYGGRVSRVPDGSLEAESIDLTALTVLGEPVETNLHIRRFRVSTVSHRIAGQTVAFHLTSNGKALSGRALGLRGARRSTAVTNESGWIQVRPMDPVVGVAFAGTGYRPNRTAYYEPARSAVVVPSAIRHSTWTVPGAVFGVITGATGVIGWIAIGWILRWQRRRRPKNGTL